MWCRVSILYVVMACARQVLCHGVNFAALLIACPTSLACVCCVLFTGGIIAIRPICSKGFVICLKGRIKILARIHPSTANASRNRSFSVEGRLKNFFNIKGII